jgi:hypothetical protein
MRLGLGIVGLVLAIVLFLVLRPDDDETAAPPASPTTTRAMTTTTTTTARPPQQRVTPVRITFRNGRVVGGIRHATVRRGERVRIIVRADLADQVHLHGYDILRRLRPGAPTLIVFRATVVGRFEVELEDRHILLAEIDVRP